MFRHLIPVQQQFRAFHKANVMLRFKCNSSYLIHQNCKVMHNFIVYQRRPISSSSLRLEKTKVEESLLVLKEEQTKKITKLEEDSHGQPKVKTKSSTVDVTEKPAQEVIPKRTWKKRIIDEIIHYYNGFRLLFVDIRICSKLLFRLLKGAELSRRENKQLVRTVSDIFRLVPFTVILVIPFMELLLPVLLKFFPQMLPSTFQTATDNENKFKAKLKIKIEMAKFLQDTLNELALHAKGEAHSENAKEFAIFFEKIRSSGAGPTNEQILKFSKLFEDELTLDSLPRSSLIALCRLLELRPIGTDNLLRFQLRMRLRSLKADDQLIKNEGIEALSVMELQAACRARGMRALGLSQERLRSQLNQWLELSLAEQIPASLLLLSRALYLPENLDAPDQLKATLSILPDAAATEAKYKIGEIEGKVDNKTKLELIKKEEAEIKKEAEEKVQETKEAEKAQAEETKDKAPVLEDKAPVFEDKAPVLEDKAPIVKDEEVTDKKEEELSKEDFDQLEDALENISKEKKALLVEKEEIQELKEDMAEYKEDIEELKEVIHETGHEELSESKAALRLSNKVNKMISKMDSLLQDLTDEKTNLQQQIHDKDKEGVCASKEKDNIVGINELVLAIRRIQKVSDDTRLQRIADVLEKMDVDHDGAVEIDHVLKVIELLGEDNVKVTPKQMDEIIDLLMKEDTLELEEKLQKQKQKNDHEKTSKEAV